MSFRYQITNISYYSCGCHDISCLHMRIGRFVLLNPFFFSIAFFQLENPFFVKAGSTLDEAGFQSSMATSHISSLVMMQPLKSFKPCRLKRTFCWILTPEGHWKFSAGMDYLILKQRLGGLSCVFVVSSLPAIVIESSKSFSFPGCSLILIVFFDYSRLCH